MKKLLITLAALPALFGASLEAIDATALQRQPGTYRYRLTQAVHTPDGILTSEVLFDLVKKEQSERIVVRKATRKDAPHAPAGDYAMDEE